jgi:hypothetical protein
MDGFTSAYGVFQDAGEGSKRSTPADGANINEINEVTAPKGGGGSIRESSKHNRQLEDEFAYPPRLAIPSYFSPISSPSEDKAHERRNGYTIPPRSAHSFSSMVLGSSRGVKFAPELFPRASLPSAPLPSSAMSMSGLKGDDGDHDGKVKAETDSKGDFLSHGSPSRVTSPPSRLGLPPKSPSRFGARISYSHQPCTSEASGSRFCPSRESSEGRMAPSPPAHPTAISKSRRSSQSITSRIGSIIMGNTYSQNSVVPVSYGSLDNGEVASRLKTLKELAKK